MHFFLLFLFVLGVSSHNMTMIERIKANPKQFVEEMAKVDPTKLQEIIDLLEALRATSHTEESNLLSALDNAKVATDDAALAVADAEEDKKNADDEVVTAQSDLATVKDTAETNIGTATSALHSRKTEAEDAQIHLDDMVGAHTAREAEQAQAQAELDGELPALDSEQQTLADVISILENLIETHYVMHGRGDPTDRCEAVDGDCSTRLARNDQIHAIRCCSDTEVENFFKGNRPLDGCWGSSYFGQTDRTQVLPYPSEVTEVQEGCSRGTWSQANEKCTLEGGRLCTRAELVGGCTQGTGCWFDYQPVWTSDRD